jgi:hypothetical protein
LRATLPPTPHASFFRANWLAAALNDPRPLKVI